MRVWVRRNTLVVRRTSSLPRRLLATEHCRFAFSSRVDSLQQYEMATMISLFCRRVSCVLVIRNGGSKELEAIGCQANFAPINFVHRILRYATCETLCKVMHNSHSLHQILTIPQQNCSSTTLSMWTVQQLLAR